MRPSRIATAAVILLGSMLAAGCGAAGSGGSGGTGDQPVNVGAVLTLTGLGAEFGAAQKAAIELAFDDARKDGVNVALKVEDSGESNTVALSALQSVLRDQPVAVVGPFLGSQIMAMRPKLESSQTPMVATSGTPSITEDNNTMVFRYAATLDLSEPATATWAAQNLGFAKPAILFDNSAYGQQGTALVERALARAGKTVVAKESFNPSDTDLTGQLHKITQAGADALFVQVVGGAPGAVVLKGLETSGAKLPIIWGSGIVYHSLLDLTTATQVEGIYGNTMGTEAVNSATTNPGIADLLRRYKEKTGRDGDASVVLNYDAARAIAAAIKDGNRTPTDVTAWLKSSTYHGLLGDYHADAQGNMIHSTTIVQIKDKQPVAVTTVRGT